MADTENTRAPAGGLTVTLTEPDAAFLAARLRRLFAHFGYKLPAFALTDGSVIRIAGSCIGGLLASAAPAGGPTPVAWRFKLHADGQWHVDEEKPTRPDRLFCMEPLYASAAPAAEPLPLTKERVKTLAGEAGFVVFGQWRLWQGDDTSLFYLADAIERECRAAND